MNRPKPNLKVGPMGTIFQSGPFEIQLKHSGPDCPVPFFLTLKRHPKHMLSSLTGLHDPSFCEEFCSLELENLAAVVNAALDELNRKKKEFHDLKNQPTKDENEAD